MVQKRVVVGWEMSSRDNGCMAPLWGKEFALRLVYGPYFPRTTYMMLVVQVCPLTHFMTIIKNTQQKNT